MLMVGSGSASRSIGDGWVDGNVEFVREVRLKKLLEGKLEPSGVKENGLFCILSMLKIGVA